MRRTVSILFPLVLLAGCEGQDNSATVKPSPDASAKRTVRGPSSPALDTNAGAAAGKPTLAEARRGFKTTLMSQGSANEPVPEPPPSVFRLVRYDSPVGKLAAYLTPDPGDGQKHPAIVWITGGDCNTHRRRLGGGAARQRPDRRRLSQGRYRHDVPLAPRRQRQPRRPRRLPRRGGRRPRRRPIISRSQGYVDPRRIYLGGHSTGGTLVMLVAASTDRFRAVFSFGPVDNVPATPASTSRSTPPTPRSSSCVRRAAGCTRSAVRSSSSRVPIGRATSVACRRWRSASTNPMIRFLP